MAKEDWEDDATAVVSHDDLAQQLAAMGADASALTGQSGRDFHSEKTKVVEQQPYPDSEPTLAVASPVFDADTVRPPPSGQALAAADAMSLADNQVARPSPAAELQLPPAPTVPQLPTPVAPPAAPESSTGSLAMSEVSRATPSNQGRTLFYIVFLVLFIAAAGIAAFLVYRNLAVTDATGSAETQR